MANTTTTGAEVEIKDVETVDGAYMRSPAWLDRKIDLMAITLLTLCGMVKTIGGHAFSDCKGLTSLTLGASVLSIGGNAFSHCIGIASLVIPDSVVSIGFASFAHCKGLKSLTLGTSVVSIGYAAFSVCIGIASLVIPDSVKTIRELAFWGCKGLTSLALGASVVSIGERAFEGCIGLASLVIPDSVRSIGKGAFCGTSLTSVVVPAGCEVHPEAFPPGCTVTKAAPAATSATSTAAPEVVASGTCPSQGGTGSQKPPPSKARDADKEANDGNEGLMMNRGEFRKGGATGKREVLFSGAKKDCLADATAKVTGDDNKTVRDFLGEDRSFDRATEYVATAHPDWALDNVSDDVLNSPGGVETALLNCDSGKFVLQQTYKVDGEKRYHCAALDMGEEWGPVESVDLQTGERVVKSGRGILYDNQADVKVHLAEFSDREKYAARKFFAEPYPQFPDMRITRVYELVSVEEAAVRAVAREERKRAKQQKQAEKAKQKKRAQDTQAAPKHPLGEHGSPNPPPAAKRHKA